MEKIREVMNGISELQPAQKPSDSEALRNQQSPESGKTKAEIIEQEGENEYIAAVKRAMKDQIGMRYVKYFKESEIEQRELLNVKIRDLIYPGKGILLTGQVGTGKTMDMIYIFQKVLQYEKGNRNLLYHAEAFVEKKIRYYFMPSLFEKLHFAEKAPLAEYVLLDDWGREYSEPFALQRFEVMIEKMYKNETKIVIATNLTQEEFKNRPGWLRINDRVREVCGVLKIQGESRRHK